MRHPACFQKFDTSRQRRISFLYYTERYKKIVLDFFFLLNAEFVTQYSKPSGPILNLKEYQVHMLAKFKCENCFTCEFEPRCAKHIEKNEICMYFGTRIPNSNGYFTIKL